ncbi:BQ5605_C005g03353 [Microbotryum silenes-dioicae]|uniref:BQ5605_C005g03353 protein n=1 Tax=Microbotryum silenes-dioicae TaxID=796604 RepID=A0A2X0P5U3_9BASI|nr:BQ5605_C005g03353 [Microbotryum silenes-dioicae]
MSSCVNPARDSKLSHRGSLSTFPAQQISLARASSARQAFSRRSPAPRYIAGVAVPSESAAVEMPKRAECGDVRAPSAQSTATPSCADGSRSCKLAWYSGIRSASACKAGNREQHALCPACIRLIVKVLAALGRAALRPRT